IGLTQSLLDQLDTAGIIDRHLPPDLLLAARLCQPTALINLPGWAERTSADILWNLLPTNSTTIAWEVPSTLISTTAIPCSPAPGPRHCNARPFVPRPAAF